MSTEIHCMTCVFGLFKNTRDCFHTPAIEVGILVTVISALRQCISSRRWNSFGRGRILENRALLLIGNALLLLSKK